MAGSKSTLAGGDKEKKKRKKEKRGCERFFFKIRKGRNKNLWTWPAEMSQLNNREIKVCNGLPRIDSCGIAVFGRIAGSEPLDENQYLWHVLLHRNWVDGIDVVKSNARLFNGRTTPFVRPRHESRIFQDTIRSSADARLIFRSYPIVTCIVTFAIARRLQEDLQVNRKNSNYYFPICNFIIKT